MADSRMMTRFRGILESMVNTQKKSGLPWSYRNTTVAVVVTVIAAVASAMVGSVAHRLGASVNLPYGLVLSLLLVALSTWCARMRMPVFGGVLHVLVSVCMAWWLTGAGAGGSVLIVAGFGAPVPWWSAHVGYWWLYGMVVVQLVVVLMPRRWCVMPRDTPAGESADESLQVYENGAEVGDIGSGEDVGQGGMIQYSDEYRSDTFRGSVGSGASGEIAAAVRGRADGE